MLNCEYKAVERTHPRMKFDPKLQNSVHFFEFWIVSTFQLSSEEYVYTVRAFCHIRLLWSLSQFCLPSSLINFKLFPSLNCLENTEGKVTWS
jgi:hypothetical protein